MNMTILAQKILSTALAAVITVSVSSSALKKITDVDRYTSAAAKTVEDQLNSTMSRTVTIKVTPANVRSGAGKSYAVIGTAAKGKTYQYLGTKKDAKGKRWYKIQFTQSQTGWILVSLGNLSDEINSSLFTATTTTTTTTSSPRTFGFITRACTFAPTPISLLCSPSAPSRRASSAVTPLTMRTGR